MTDQELDERVARAVDNFMQGYGCCQSVVAAYIKNFQVEDLEQFKAAEPEAEA